MVRSRRRLIAVVIVGIVGLCLAQQKEEDNGKKMTAASKDKKKVIAGILITPESLGLGKAVKLERDEASVDAEEGFSKGEVTVEARIGTSKVEPVYDIYVCKSPEVAKRIAKSRMLGYFLAQGGVPIGLPLETAGIKADYGNVFYIRLNLVRPKPNAKRYVLAGLWFAVRNIIVVIRPKNEAANGHILPIAKKVADYLRKQPTYKSLEASGLCPKIIAKPEKTTTTAKVAMEEIEVRTVTVAVGKECFSVFRVVVRLPAAQNAVS